jgi:hypothetical protein
MASSSSRVRKGCSIVQFAALREEILAEASDRFEQRLGEECGKLSDRFERRLSEESGKLSDRFERRLGEECGKLRAELRADMADMKHELKHEITNTKADLIKWCFLFWVGQFLGVATLLAAFVN